jgi:hypothetical protein
MAQKKAVLSNADKIRKVALSCKYAAVACCEALFVYALAWTEIIQNNPRISTTRHPVRMAAYKTGALFVGHPH